MAYINRKDRGKFNASAKKATDNFKRQRPFAGLEDQPIAIIVQRNKQKADETPEDLITGFKNWFNGLSGQLSNS